MMSTAAEFLFLAKSKFPPTPLDGLSGTPVSGELPALRRAWRKCSAATFCLCQCAPVVFCHRPGGDTFRRCVCRTWVTSDYARESDEAAGVLRPALQDGEVEEGEVAVLDDFFTRAGGNGLRKKLSGLGEERKHLEFVEEALRGFEVQKDADAVGEFVEGVDPEGELHAGFRAELD